MKLQFPPSSLDVASLNGSPGSQLVHRSFLSDRILIRAASVESTGERLAENANGAAAREVGGHFKG
jgi:hypothetical protein